MKLKIFTFIIATMLFSCAKSNINDEIKPNDDTNAQEQQSSISNIDGVIHFSDSKAFAETATILSTKDKLTEFETKYNFKSMSGILDDAIEEISEAKSIDELKSLKAKHSGILNTSDELITPKVIARIYTNVCNKDGIFYIGDSKYKITPTEVLIYNTSNTKSGNAPFSYNYIVENTDNNTTKGLVSNDKTCYVDVQLEKDKRKVFARFHLIKMYYTNEPPMSGFHEDYSFQIHMSAQKKSWLGWNSYKTSYMLEEFHCRMKFEYAGAPDWQPVDKEDLTKFHFGSYDNLYNESSNGDMGDFYITRWIGSRTTNAVFKGFDCITFRARSRGTGNCGAVYDMCRCKPGISTWYVRSCI